MPDLKTKLEELQQEYSKTRYNKATNKHLGILRRKISDVKKELSKPKSRSGVGFSVKKTGDSTVALVGFPNAGKSSLIGLLTGVESKVAGYSFTTVSVIPGMLEYNGASIQILDVPGLIEGAHTGKGEGAKIASAVRVCDLLLFVIDVNHPEQLYKLVDELYDLKIIVNRKKPNIRIEKKLTGGIEIESLKKKIPDKKSITNILNDFKIFNAKVIFYSDADLEDLFEIVEGNSVYINAIVALNKIDTVDMEYAERIRQELEKTTKMKTLLTSAIKNTGIPKLKDSIFSSLNLMRIYLKPNDGETDLSKPIVVKSGSTVFDVAKALHSKMAKNTKYAYVSGRSVRFENQKVGIDHILSDQDVVTIIYDKY
ncbi:MAG: GTP-binding protein [Candidatus Marsarchaeota archaeon]|nr:GTP-binding protein [Candidatus Marsarchaeota archaeon]